MVLELWMWDDWLCKCVLLVYYTSLMVSSFTMTAMAMERRVSFLSKQGSAFVQGERKYYDLDQLKVYSREKNVSIKLVKKFYLNLCNSFGVLVLNIIKYCVQAF